MIMTICLGCGTQTNNPKFCSHSCAAKINNIGVRRHGMAARYCIVCGTQCKRGGSRYCSLRCSSVPARKERDAKIESNIPTRWSTIRHYLIRKIGKCQGCGIENWRGQPLAFECDHIDGDGSNNILSNARLLCPNCHSQTPTFRARNTSNPKGKDKRRARYLKRIKMEPPAGVEPAFSVPVTVDRVEASPDYGGELEA